MIPIPVFAYKWIAIGAVILLLGIGLKIQTARLDSVKKEYAAFQAQVKAVGDAQEAATKLKDAENQTRMEKANAQNLRAKRDLAGVYDAYRKLRESRASSGDVPSAPTFAPSADRTTFDSQELVGAIRVLEAGVLGIIQQGDQAIVDLNTAKEWAKPN